MNISFCLTKHYGNFRILGRRKNKANSNPIKPNLKNAKMNLSSVKTKEYVNEPRLRPPAKQTQSNPISYLADSTQIAQSAAVSVTLIQPVRDVELIKKGISRKCFLQLIRRMKNSLLCRYLHYSSSVLLRFRQITAAAVNVFIVLLFWIVIEI